MTIEDQQLNNPLHGLKLDTLLNELVNHYGFEILAEYTNINCFKNRATIASSLKFLRKTEWAREKMERFYLYTFKNLPKADDTQYEITPRQRIIPAHQQPREPKVLIRGEAPDPTVRSNNKPHSYSKTSSSQSKEHFRDKRTKNNSNKQSNETFDPWGNSPK